MAAYCTGLTAAEGDLGCPVDVLAGLVDRRLHLAVEVVQVPAHGDHDRGHRRAEVRCLRKDLKELLNLKDCKNLKSLTIHGNPVETINNFRIYTIALLPQLKKIDTVLVSKKEKDNAFVWIHAFKNSNIPEAKNAIKPPEMVQQQPEQK